MCRLVRWLRVKVSVIEPNLKSYVKCMCVCHLILPTWAPGIKFRTSGLVATVFIQPPHWPKTAYVTRQAIATFHLLATSLLSRTPRAEGELTSIHA